VEVDTDIVTMIPKVFGMYRHSGVQVVIDSDEAGDIYLSYFIVFLFFLLCIFCCFSVFLLRLLFERNTVLKN
jgi:hypothetical protein